MRLGGPVAVTDDPAGWAAEHLAQGYRAAYWPNPPIAREDDFMRAAADAGLVIAEVGAWSNPLSPDPAERERALAYCISQLATAERVGARCCVNIAGSLGPKWDGPAGDDLTEAAFARIVATTQAMLDAVHPTRTFFTLETMPWMYPDSVASYQQLLAAIDRPGFAVHLDPANLINCPARYFRSGDLIRDAVAALGPHIRSCHAKDIRLDTRMTVHLDEVAPGEGGLDYAAYLRALDTLDPDTPLMLEHLPMEAYPGAAAYIRTVAADVGISL